MHPQFIDKDIIHDTPTNALAGLRYGVYSLNFSLRLSIIGGARYFRTEMGTKRAWDSSRQVTGANKNQAAGLSSRQR